MPQRLQDFKSRWIRHMPARQTVAFCGRYLATPKRSCPGDNRAHSASICAHCRATVVIQFVPLMDEAHEAASPSLFGCVALLVSARRWPVVNHLMLSADWVSPLLLSVLPSPCRVSGVYGRQSCQAISLFLCFDKTWPVACLVRSACRP